MRAAVIAAVALAAPVAHADPSWVRASVAKRAVDIVHEHPVFVTYCEPCGDKAPSAPETATAVRINHIDVDDKTVAINGTARWLGWTYVQIAPDRYANLGDLAGASVTAAPPSLRVTDENEHGVMITPDWAPVRVSAPPAPAPRPEPLVVSAPQIIFVPVDEGPPWALLGGIVGLATGVTGVLLAIALPRRRRSSLPRAIDLR